MLDNCHHYAQQRRHVFVSDADVMTFRLMTDADVTDAEVTKYDMTDCVLVCVVIS